MILNHFCPSYRNNNVYIVDIGEEDSVPSKRKEVNYRAQYVIHFVVSGTGSFKSKGLNFSTDNELSENMSFAIYKQSSIDYFSHPNDLLHYFWISFDGEESKKLLEYVGFNETKPTIKLTNKEEIIQAFNNIFDSLKVKNDPYLALSEFYKLLYLLHKNNISTPNNFVQVDDSLIIKPIVTYIFNNLDKDIKINEIVNSFHIDRSYFSKIFKQIYHLSPHQYILNQRLSRARLFLTTSNYSISQIANMLNFTDIYSFSKQFKRKYKTSPLKYRQIFLSKLSKNKKTDE